MPPKQTQLGTAWERVQQAVPTVAITASHRRLYEAECGGDELTHEDLERRGEVARVARRIQQIDRELKTYARRPTSRHSSRRPAAVGWRRRAALEYEALAARANADPEVQAFRARYVSGWPLSQAEATAFAQRSELGDCPLIVCPPSLTGGPYIKVRHSSLARFAQQLAGKYGWLPSEAVWFVLGEVVPFGSPLEVDVEIHEERREVRITVSAAHYVPTVEIAAAINRQKRELTEEEWLGNPQTRQALTERQAALVRFMEREPDGQPRLVRALVRRWNAQVKRAWHYSEKDPRHLWRDVQRARAKIAR